MPDKAQKFRFEVKNQADNNSEILIYGFIGKWEDVDYKGFRNSFQNILSTNKDVTVRIHSGGGSVYEGLAIYDLMRSSDSNITVIVEGMAASMASIIALGGDVIKMTENAFFMMHAPTTGCWGDQTAMQSSATQLIQAENRLVAIYKERSEAGESVILDWMKPNNDTWIDSAKCLEMKLCDEIIKPSKNRAHQTIPEDIVNKTPEEIFAAYEGDIPNEIKNKYNLSMKNRIITMLAAASIAHKLTATSEDSDFEKILEDVISKAGKCEKAEADLKGFQSTNAKILIDKAVEEGKLTAAEKEQWTKDAETNYDLTARALSKMTGKVDINNGINRDPKDTADTHELLKGRVEWTYADWQEKDAEGLQKLQAASQTDFDKLFNAQYKK